MLPNICGAGLNIHLQANHQHFKTDQGNLDSLGMLASTVCMVHCMAMPFVIGLLPAIGLSFLEGHAAHQILAFFVVGFALAAVLPAYLKHKRASVLWSMIGGIALVLLATFGSGVLFPESYELPLITVGNMIVVFSHWRNRHLLNQ